MNRIIQMTAAGILAAFLASYQRPAMSQTSLFENLAGPGESVELRAKMPEDGGERRFDIEANPDGSIKSFIGVGRVILRSPRINLDCDRLEYAGSEGILEATGHVEIEQPQIEATCERMLYDVESGVIRLLGNPEVMQENAENRTQFIGMDEFILKRQEDGSTEINMEGGEEILVEIMPAEGTASPPGSGEQTSEAGSNSGGFAGLGNEVRIMTRAGAEDPPSVFVDGSKEGGIGLFRAEGSVVVNSPRMNLRSDLLEYDGRKEVIEALHNVFVSQENIEADAGRMLYDVASGQMTLTVSPVVREQGDSMVTTFREMDTCIIQQREDGTVKLETIGGPEGQPVINMDRLPEAAQPVPDTEDTPTEIDIESDVDLQNLTTQ